LREVFGKATQAPSPSSKPQVIMAEGPAVKEVRVPQPAPVVPKELADRLTALEERMSKFEASLERPVEAIDGQDRALIDEVSRLREELNMVRREYEKIQQLQQAIAFTLT
jgi:archaellum component FlaC